MFKTLKKLTENPESEVEKDFERFIEAPEELNRSRYPAGEIYVAAKDAVSELGQEYGVNSTRLELENNDIATYGLREKDLTERLVEIYEENPSYSVKTLTNKAVEEFEELWTTTN